MPLKYIINTLAREIGAHPTNQRAMLLGRINAAAKELYESTDLPGSLREGTFEITSDAVIALPYYVGPLRAMRHSNIKYRVELNDMSPKYNYQAWTKDWNNWRVLPTSPIQRSIVNASLPIFVSIASVDTLNVNITFVGSTVSAQRVRETVTMLAGETEQTLTTAFTNIISISKDITNNQDITVTGADADGNEITLAVIPNDRLESSYTIVDVSKYPGLNATCMDVLFKFPLFEMLDDGDTFPCEGFDDAIVYKCLHIWYANQANGGEKSMGYYNKVNQIIFERTTHTNGTTQKEITFAPNQYFDLIPRRGGGSIPAYYGRRYR